jgi:hypothetical protein
MSAIACLAEVAVVGAVAGVGLGHLWRRSMRRSDLRVPRIERRNRYGWTTGFWSSIYLEDLVRALLFRCTDLQAEFAI